MYNYAVSQEGMRILHLQIVHFLRTDVFTERQSETHRGLPCGIVIHTHLHFRHSHHQVLSLHPLTIPSHYAMVRRTLQRPSILESEPDTVLHPSIEKVGLFERRNASSLHIPPQYVGFMFCQGLY